MTVRFTGIQKVVAAAVIAFGAGTLAGCGAGADAPVRQLYPAGWGINGAVADLQVVNALVVAPKESGAPAALVGAIVNKGTAELSLAEVRFPGGNATTAELPTLTPEEAVTIGGPDNPQVPLENLVKPVGTMADLEFVFSDGNILQLQVPIVAPHKEFEEFALG